ncbi:MAG: DUF2520 domain-containing protein [Thermoleophilia bacterium]|nr:DUF2520 domain-containing protein [Thermoleophilia bacterium]
MELELGPLRFGIVGAGRLGCVVGRALQRQGLEVVHASSASAEGRERASKLLEVPVHEDPVAVTQQVDCVLLCVPDHAMAEVVARVATQRPDDASPIRLRVVSMSAFGGLALLDPLVDAGHEVAVLHPMASINDDDAVLSGAGAAVGSANDAMRTMAHALAHALELHPFDLADEAWALHAAACTFAANGATALMSAIEDLAAEAGEHPEMARAAYGQLAMVAIDRAMRLGTVPALAGPILRGDAGAVAAQLTAVRGSASQTDALFIPIVATIANRAFTSGRIGMDAHREVLEAVLDPTQFEDGEFRYRKGDD